MQPLLKVEDLRTSFFTEQGELRAVDGVGFSVDSGKLLGLVGESGSGKTVTALSIMRLLPETAKITSGKILFEGSDLRTLQESEMRKVRGAKIAMIFQEPMTSLNPVFTVGSQIMEAIRLHQKSSRAEARERAIQMLREVKIADPERRVDDYPHQLSGGMRQRVMIAMALSCNPRLLIADEPTTALDVTIQAQILDLIQEIKEHFGLAIILVTHDLGIVAEYADDVTILYAAKVMEQARSADLFSEPLNPYTRALLQSVPNSGGVKRRRLTAIAGTMPDALHPPSGCRFHPRCPMAVDRCKRERPALRELRPGHWVACSEAH